MHSSVCFGQWNQGISPHTLAGEFSVVLQENSGHEFVENLLAPKRSFSPVNGNCRCHYLQVQVFTALITMESVNLTYTLAGEFSVVL